MSIATLSAVLIVLTAGGSSDLKRGDPAPAVELRALDGAAVVTSGRRNRALLLMFGDAGQERTQLACREAAALLRSEPLVDEPIDWILILTRSSDPAQLDLEAKGAAPPPVVAIDAERRAFGAHRVVVTPTVVIVDGSGRVAHAMAGFTDRFADIVQDGLLLALGRMDAAQFDQRLALSDSELTDEGRVRADRIASLARRLHRRGLLDLAQAQYQRALDVEPGHAPARIGLGSLLLAQGRLDDAEAQYRTVLAANRESNPAALGIAECALGRGGGALAEAMELLQEVLGRDPLHARAHYLLGLLQEQRGDVGAAAASFKRAASLLLEPQERGGMGVTTHDGSVGGGG